MGRVCIPIKISKLEVEKIIDKMKRRGKQFLALPPVVYIHPFIQILHPPADFTLKNGVLQVLFACILTGGVTIL